MFIEQAHTCNAKNTQKSYYLAGVYHCIVALQVLELNPVTPYDKTEISQLLPACGKRHGGKECYGTCLV